MDVVTTLIKATVYDPVSATTLNLYFTNRNDPRATTWAGSPDAQQLWLPVLSSAPTFQRQVFDGSFLTSPEDDAGSITVTLVDRLVDAWAGYAWDGATIIVYAGDLTTQNFYRVGTCYGSGAQRKGRLELEIGLTFQDQLLSTNMLTVAYGGTGDQDGESTLKGTLKPWVFGNAKICKAVLIDSVYQIYQVSGYGPVESIYNCYEGGQTLGASQGNYTGASFASFKSANLADGTWITCNELGMFRLANQPSFPITVDVKGDTGGTVGGTALTKTADIINRVMSYTTGIGTPNDLAVMNTNAPWPVDCYVTDQTSVADFVGGLLSTIGGYWLFGEGGNFRMGLLRFGTSLFDLDAQNTKLPDVLGVNQLPTSAPVWDLKLGANVCHYVHQASDIVQSIIELKTAVDQFGSVAAGKNRVYAASSSAPTTPAPVDGDLWPDTSSIPTVIRRYDGGSGTWQAADGLSTTYAGLVTALANLDIIANDNILSKGEKPITVQAWDSILGEYVALETQATGLGVSYTNYENARAALQTYLAGLSPGFRDVTQDTPIVGTTFRQKFIDYYTQKTVLVNAIAQAAAQSTGFSNLVRLSQFEKQLTTPNSAPVGWTLNDNPSWMTSQGVAVDTGMQRWQVNFNAPAGGGNFSVAQTYGGAAFSCAVKAGQRYYFSCRTGAAAGGGSANISGTTYLVIFFQDSSGNILTSTQVGTGTLPWGYGGVAFPTLLYNYVTAPTGACYAFLVLYTTIPSGQPASTGCFTKLAQPMICPVPVGQTGEIAYVPGPNGQDGADPTGANIAYGFQGQGALAGKNQVTGPDISVPNLATVSTAIGTLRTATSGARVEISDNVIKVYDAAGTLRVQIGNLAL